MSILNSIKNKGNQAIKSSEEYVAATQEYIELKAFQQLSLTFSLLVKVVLIGGLVFIGSLLLMVAGILELGRYLGSYQLAMLYVALGLFVIGGIIYLFRKIIIETPTIKKVSKTFFND